MIALALFGAAAIVGWFILQRFRDPKSGWMGRAAALIFLAPLAFAAIGIGSYLLIRESGTLPEPAAYTIASGVRYQRHTTTQPKPLVWHVVKVDLGTHGISLAVTSGDASKLLPFDAKTPTAVANEFHADVVLSGDFFEPKGSMRPLDEPVLPGTSLRTKGLAVSRGSILVAAKEPSATTLYISEGNIVSIGAPAGNVYNAISGDCVILKSGVVQPFNDCALPTEAHARVAAGIDAGARMLILVLVEGYRAGRSGGVTMADFARILLDEGASSAIEFAGGPSVGLAGRSPEGAIKSLNEPFSGGVPGLEPAVANHLMVTSSDRLAAP